MNEIIELILKPLKIQIPHLLVSQEPGQMGQINMKKEKTAKSLEYNGRGFRCVSSPEKLSFINIKIIDFLPGNLASLQQHWLPAGV